jgi:hypothetical protein
MDVKSKKEKVAMVAPALHFLVLLHERVQA